MTAARKGAQSLVEWYPPLVAVRHPEVAAVVSLFSPAVGKVLALGAKIFQAGKYLWKESVTLLKK